MNKHETQDSTFPAHLKKLREKRYLPKTILEVLVSLTLETIFDLQPTLKVWQEILNIGIILSNQITT